MSLLEVENLRTYFYTRGGVIRAVNDVSFSLSLGETLGIVGESGSGKSVTCYSLLGLIPKPPGKIVSGHANFGGVDLLNCPESDDFAQSLHADLRSAGRTVTGARKSEPIESVREGGGKFGGGRDPGRR